ncbi:GIY-YIG nuclease family protein [Aurantiacibacter luteus]|uniref:Endonuclease n=1 Tax=Aurantiacibacter luteus TaxID=1581420 RepID=A0A0G9MXA5_9SPHN|nr:GIY-YIG nuclease family protein [Aurantiacibacter luteus]KLE35330.1 endonuclease [Aurantiacibacter luteus]
MARDIQPCVYIMANRKNGTIYVGVTSDIAQRGWQHRQGLVDGFTRQYCCKTLVWYELHPTMESAILREKQLKAGSRKKKIALIVERNPDWRDLYAEVIA